jgi:uncharacterized protein HemX
MQVFPPKPAATPGGIDLRLVILGVLCLAGSGYWQYQRSDKIARAEADMERLELLIKQEASALHEDQKMLDRLNGERKKRLEEVIAAEAQHIEAWQAQWRDLEVSIREWKAERRVKEARP